MNLHERPKVTVLMPVFNGALFLRESINSILNQTFSQFELLVIDDGSTDDSLNILNEYHDDRIRLVTLAQNCGIVAALNLGIELTQGDYLARMDADDIAFPERLEKQLAFLEKHIEVGCVGSDFYWLDYPDEKSWIQYYDPDEVHIGLLFGCAICHPTVMFRTKDLRQHNLFYPTNYPHAEDYGLWIEFSRHTRIANLAEPLLYYRRHTAQVSNVKNDIQCASIDQIQIRQLQSLGIKPTTANLMLHHSLGGAFIPLLGLEYALSRWCQCLLNANSNTHYFPDHILTMQLQKRITDAVEATNTQLTEMTHIHRLYWRSTTWRRYLTGYRTQVLI